MTTSEAAERREMIRKFHKFLNDRVNEIDKQSLEVRRAPRSSFSGGIWDDEDERKLREDNARLDEAYRRLQAQRNDTLSFWNFVIEVFGKDAVDLAIDEGNEVIGELPFVKE